MSALSVRKSGAFAVLAVAVALALLWWAGLPAAAQEARALRGIALVIGQSEYEHLAPLANPANDADAVEELFGDLGFETTLASDRDARRLSRDLERFLEDAEDADVAVVYYAGHGIEAGGENFLVPVDADLSALDAAAEKLVPVSGFIERLQAAVPVTIVMLDACRDNPFPAGSMVTVDTASSPAPMGTGGLVETRGASRLVADRPADENFGAVMAFAAEPGRVALDGAPGANSPYTAAVLRHFDAMAGEEFGTVMRMIAEEVYLKTGGRQRPWVNESLRRLLYFGRSPEALEGTDGEILSERRQLLLTIASLPDPERRRVEQVAQEGGVPMDALYGMLAALGQEAPKDPAELEKLLREQTEKVAELFARDQTLTRTDPELQRLSELTDAALAEGAIETATRLRGDVDRRIAELATVVDDAEAQVKARRMEFAIEYVRSAQIAVARFDRLAAADYYAKAFEQAERWDDEFAMRAINSEVVELRMHALVRDDPAVLARGIERGRQAIAISERAEGPDAAAAARVNLSLLLSQQQRNTTDSAAYDEAVDHVRAALEVHTPDSKPSLWVVTYHALGHLHQIRGIDGSNLDDLAEAERIYRELVAAPAMRQNPSLWAKLHGNLATTLRERAQLTGEPALLQDAYDIAATGTAGTDRAALPVDWAFLQQVIGDVSIEAARRGAGVEAAAVAVSAYRGALSVFTRDHYRAVWADVTAKLADAVFFHGQATADKALMLEAADLVRSVAATVGRTTNAVDWSLHEGKAGSFLFTLYETAGDPVHLRAAVTAYGDALAAIGAEGTPAQRLGIAGTYADALVSLGQVENDPATIERAVAVVREAMPADADLSPADAAFANAALGKGLLLLGRHRADPALIDQAVTAFAASVAGIDRSQMPSVWTNTRREQAQALALQGGQRKLASSSTEAAAIFAGLLAAITPASAPWEWLDLQFARANALRDAGYVDGNAETMRQAAGAYRELLAAGIPLDPMQRAQVEEPLAQVTVEIGVIARDPAAVAEGRALLASAAEAYRKAGDAARADHASSMLARIDGWLSANAN